jgi:abequosyltransferase
MLPEKPLLTIAIPTYNRSQCLAQLLEILTPQLAEEPRVELIVSDNSSSDDTPSVIGRFLQSGLALTYSRNETNIGADANFIRCYELAQGEYVWVFGDDDIIVPGGLREVLSRLETREFDLLYIHAKGFKEKYHTPDKVQFSHKMKVFPRPVDFALAVYTSLTFISGNIFRKAAIESMPHFDFNTLIGTNLAQLSWTLSLLQGNPRCAVLLDNLVAARVENSGGHGTCQVFGTNLQAIVKEFVGVQSPVGRAILNRTVQSWFPWAMLASRRRQDNKHLPEDSEAILKGLYRGNPRYWLFVHPVFRLPIPLAAAWVFAGKVISRFDRLVGYPIARCNL